MSSKLTVTVLRRHKADERGVRGPHQRAPEVVARSVIRPVRGRRVALDVGWVRTDVGYGERRRGIRDERLRLRPERRRQHLYQGLYVGVRQLKAANKITYTCNFTFGQFLYVNWGK